MSCHVGQGMYHHARLPTGNNTACEGHMENIETGFCARHCDYVRGNKTFFWRKRRGIPTVTLPVFTSLWLREVIPGENLLSDVRFA